MQTLPPLAVQLLDVMISNPGNQGHGQQQQQQQLDRTWLVVLDAEIELPATQPRELSSTWQLTGYSRSARGGAQVPKGRMGIQNNPWETSSAPGWPDRYGAQEVFDSWAHVPKEARKKQLLPVPLYVVRLVPL